MAKSVSVAKAVQHLERRGMLLVYPIDNRADPRSLWSEFFPGRKMRWEWDADGDDRVADVWHLKTELSASGKAVYAKWFRGRATFFSRSFFVDLLACLGGPRADRKGLSREARAILETLESDSPLSTKQLKAATDLRGKFFESTYEKAMRELWRRLLIVGFGEVEDGAFPSLAVGATKHHFEDLWEEAAGVDPRAAGSRIDAIFPRGTAFEKFLRALRSPASAD